MPIVKYIKGNLLGHPFQIAHGVNCQGVMGSGVALAIKNKYPNHFNDYINAVKLNRGISSDLLGKITDDPSKEDKILGMFTQDFYGKDGKRYVNYAAIGSAFREVSDYLSGDPDDSFCPLGIPKIGAGLGGGDWNIIEQIINDASLYYPIWVYEL